MEEIWCIRAFNKEEDMVVAYATTEYKARQLLNYARESELFAGHFLEYYAVPVDAFVVDDKVVFECDVVI